MIDIGVLGTGYVGLVTGACLARTETNYVTCLDIDKAKINMLHDGVPPIYEKDLTELVEEGVRSKRLSFSFDIETLIDSFKVIFIAVGTPSNEDGTVNLDYVKSACEMIKNNCTSPKVIVMKSTVPTGTYLKMKKWVGDEHTVISNPEFLREGTAVMDFFDGDRIVVGTPDGIIDFTMSAVYVDYMEKIVWMDNASAEVVKYASNCLLATKLALWNEIAVLCDSAGANIHQVRMGVGTDSRIGPRFLLAGPGYGGSCFPKDTRGLYYTFRDSGLLKLGYGKIIGSVIDSNDNHKKLPYYKFANATMLLDHSVMNIGILGLAFKGGTDDVRESPTHELLKLLDQTRKYNIIVADPVATELPILDNDVVVTTDYVKAIQHADVLFVMTEWNQYKNIDPEYVKTLMNDNGEPIVIDARNMWNREACEQAGLRYYAIGS